MLNGEFITHLQATASQSAAVAAPLQLRSRGRQYCVAAMTGGGDSDSSGPRRIILWFRNDLRLRDNAIVHQAVQKVKAKEYDEVSQMTTVSNAGSLNRHLQVPAAHGVYEST